MTHAIDAGSSSTSKDNSNNMAKIKASKITANLFGGGEKVQMYTADNTKFNRLNEYYYDGNQSKSVNSNTNPIQAVKTENHKSLENKADIDRTTSLDMLCSLDLVKFPQNQSLESLSNFPLQSSTQVPTTFPWYGGANQNTSSNETNTNHINHIYDGNIQASTSSVSLSDFAMSLWPSMNNLVTAAEALSNNQIVTEPNQFNNKNQLKSLEEFPKSSSNLGSLSKLQSLSNVALDELEALEEEKLKNNNQSTVNSSSSKSSSLKSAREVKVEVFNRSPTLPNTITSATVNNKISPTKNPVKSEISGKVSIQIT